MPKTVGKVGIVESDLEECAKIASALRRADFEVLEANDYDGAYEMLRERQPDVLLLNSNPPRKVFESASNFSRNWKRANSIRWSSSSAQTARNLQRCG